MKSIIANISIYKMSRTRTPHCKVCQDAGKPYDTHWVKDRNGNTTCPTLLNTECRYCYKLGHTAKYCDILAKKNKVAKKVEQSSHKVIDTKPVEKKKPVNRFADLSDDDCEIGEAYFESCKKKWPILFEPPSWAGIVAKPKEENPTVPVIEDTGFIVLSKKPIEKPILKKSWADLSDSEDEENNYNDSWDN